MAELPAMPLWTDAYLGDTHHLSTVEHGAYLLLLIAGWRRGGWLPDDEKQLAKIAGLKGVNWTRAWGTLRGFFFSANGKLFQKRQLDELAQSRKRSKAGRKNADARWNRDQPGLPLGDQQSELQSDQHTELKSEDLPKADKPLKTKKQADATAMPSQCYQNQNQNQEKETTLTGGKETDDEDVFAIPTKRARQLPKDWAPPPVDDLTETVRARVVTWEPGEYEIQCEQFADHWRGTGKPMIDWDATLRTWLNKHHGYRRPMRNGNGGGKPSGWGPTVGFDEVDTPMKDITPHRHIGGPND